MRNGTIRTAILILVMSMAISTITYTSAIIIIHPPLIEITHPVTPCTDTFTFGRIRVWIAKDAPDIAHMEYILDEQEPVRLTNFSRSEFSYPIEGFTITATFLLDNLSIGIHELKAIAVDTNNKSITTVANFSVDMDYPVYHPRFQFLSPTDQVYTDTDIPLVFVMDGEIREAYYFLDSIDREGVRIEGNTTLLGLPEGDHTVYVLATNSFGERIMQRTHFTISLKNDASPTGVQTIIFAITILIMAILATSGIIFSHKKANKKAKFSLSCLVKERLIKIFYFCGFVVFVGRFLNRN